jgi:hypothetical protein
MRPDVDLPQDHDNTRAGCARLITLNGLDESRESGGRPLYAPSLLLPGAPALNAASGDIDRDGPFG